MSANTSPQELLDTAHKVASRTRRARQAYWFPLLVFGTIAAAASPFYRLTPPSTGLWNAATQPTRLFVGGYYLPGNGRAADLYWLIAMALGYSTVVLFYRLRARRTGVAGRVWPYAAVGLGLLALLVLTGSEVPPAINLSRLLPLEAMSRDLAPLLIIALGLAVLAWSERSAALAWFAAFYLALAVVANLYDMQNVFYRVGWLSPDQYAYANLPNLLVPALTLLLGGGLFALRARWTR